jgi:hypothetical protein
MPIKKENAGRYPPNWREIRATILARAGYRCEGSPDYPDCRAPHGWFKHARLGYLTNDRKTAEQWAKTEGKVTTIVLTVAHLDHTPENCDPANLRAWCQRCHLHYDRALHKETASKTRSLRKAIRDLFPALASPVYGLAHRKTETCHVEAHSEKGNGDEETS